MPGKSQEPLRRGGPSPDWRSSQGVMEVIISAATDTVEVTLQATDFFILRNVRTRSQKGRSTPVTSDLAGVLGQ